MPLNVFTCIVWCLICFDSFSSVLSLQPTDISSDIFGVKPSHISVKKQQKEGKKIDIQRKPRATHTHSPNERPHSLADLKMYKDTKILVAKFLEHSSCSLPPEVQQVVNNIKCVIKLDEKHMEEAIFSANVIDQVTKLDSLEVVVLCKPAFFTPVLFVIFSSHF